ncbi:50S ribosomal protein L19e [Candidatus Micrarchaeota archaeon]|nr:50S ribosomal protein L19e [Candidatus Micrarchaeota archaeon]
MSFATVRRLAAKIFRVGESRVRFAEPEKAISALTGDDVRELVKNKSVLILPVRGVSRAKARFNQSRKQAGRGRGPGSKRGGLYARMPKKERWIRKVRSQRRILKNTLGLESKFRRKVYGMVKGNAFKAKKQLVAYLKDQKTVEKKTE